jgi:hypothetical protein
MIEEGLITLVDGRHPLIELPLRLTDPSCKSVRMLVQPVVEPVEQLAFVELAFVVPSELRLVLVAELAVAEIELHYQAAQTPAEEPLLAEPLDLLHRLM